MNATCPAGMAGVPSYSCHSRAQEERGTTGYLLTLSSQHSVLRFASAERECAGGLSCGKYLNWPGSDTHYFCLYFIIKD